MRWRAARRRATARFALPRLIQGIFVVWVAVTITFIGLHLGGSPLFSGSGGAGSWEQLRGWTEASRAGNLTGL